MGAFMGGGLGGLEQSFSNDVSNLFGYATQVGAYEIQQASGAPAPSGSLGSSSLIWIALLAVAAFFIYKEA